MEIKKINVGDIEIAYKEKGKGPVILFIMGYSATMDMWPQTIIDALTENNRVIVFDNRGMGLTTFTDKEFTIELFAEDTSNLLKALDIEKANIFGYSMGTNVALELAIKHPEQVNKMILLSGDCGGKEMIMPAEEVLQKLFDTSGTPRERGERLLGLMFSKTWLEEHPDPREYMPHITEYSLPENIKRQYSAIENWQGAYDNLSKICHQTLLITGKDDILTPAINSSLLAENMQAADLIQMEGGHGLLYQSPSMIIDIVLGFID